ncbi:hypothetical protein SLEP1_g55622 [Rubroshorea leprosula]|uniref:Uncharacterized protein n=1 Tax=Rubroshorea leprosula TaxID=152421 RepID=A0AAV5MFW0_9ROSI|nr:hypothetical protein SLEP1_g55622 [Rubroshorea leprosula]
MVLICLSKCQFYVFSVSHNLFNHVAGLLYTASLKLGPSAQHLT